MIYKIGCGKELSQVPDVLVCGEDYDLDGDIILCDECKARRGYDPKLLPRTIGKPIPLHEVKHG